MSLYATLTIFGFLKQSANNDQCIPVNKKNENDEKRIQRETIKTEVANNMQYSL